MLTLPGHRASFRNGGEAIFHRSSSGENQTQYDRIDLLRAYFAEFSQPSPMLLFRYSDSSSVIRKEGCVDLGIWVCYQNHHGFHQNFDGVLGR
ncbi:hypothetical protein ES705_49481 [subsurface metagenome]